MFIRRLKADDGAGIAPKSNQILADCNTQSICELVKKTWKSILISAMSSTNGMSTNA